MERRKRFIRIRETLQSFDSLYSEINEYNTSFWSKFLALFRILFGFLIINFLFILFFKSLPIIIAIVIVYALVIFIIIFNFMIFTASSVTYSANKSYKILNLLFISYSQSNRIALRSTILTKLKVNQKLSIELNVSFFIFLSSSII